MDNLSLEATSLHYISVQHDTVKTIMEQFRKVAHAPRYAPGYLDIGDINVLPQFRHTFEDLDVLAQSIAERNLLNPITVALFDEPNCARYLAAVDRVWGGSHTLADLKPVEPTNGDDTAIYPVLIAGERRYRAITLLKTVGCEQCQEEYGEGPCYDRHFDDPAVEVRLVTNCTPYDAIEIQAQENTHRRVPPHEDAVALANIYALYKDIEPGLTYTGFGRCMGRSAEVISNALRYNALPEDIQLYVSKRQLNYGIALELPRLQQAGLGSEELNWWVMKALTSRIKTDDFRATVSEFLRNRQSGQSSFLEIFSAEQGKRCGSRPLSKPWPKN